MEASLVWFRRDLRHFDHAALHHALRQSRRVYCVFVFDTDILNPLRHKQVTPDRRVVAIHLALQELRAALHDMGGELIVLHDRAIDAIPRLAQNLRVDAVFANRDYEPQAVARDAQVDKRLQEQGQRWITCKDQVIFETDEVLSQTGKTFSVFTPYKRAWLKKLQTDEHGAPPFSALSPCLIAPFQNRLAVPPAAYRNDIPSLESLGFAPLAASALPFSPGISGGEKMLANFLKRLSRYDVTRDFPALDATSHLSVHLRFGTVSIRALAQHAVDAIQMGGNSGADIWLSELIWRDFYFMILDRHPHVVEHAFKPAFDLIAWETGETAQTLFNAWCQGQTGYPLVDAAMAQLNQTGFMHNRLRMVTASFLIKDLGIDWRWGERYFAQQLNDFDLAANNGGWQWAASSGCDAQPYFRIFNPVLQSEKFDPDGTFIKRYLPQLGKLDKRHIHAPWQAPANALQAADVSLGHHYPHPIVVHEIARQHTLARYGIVKAA